VLSSKRGHLGVSVEERELSRAGRWQAMKNLSEGGWVVSPKAGSVSAMLATYRRAHSTTRFARVLAT